MTEVQERLMILMDEINFICQKEQLRYVLINDTAVRVRNKGKFVDSRYEFNILMPMEDIGKFLTYVQNNKAEDRAIESWDNNAYLRQMVFRYVDKNSLLIDGPSGDYFKKPGIAITIYPARPNQLAKNVIGAERYLQQMNSGSDDRKRDWLWFLLRGRHRNNKKYKQIPKNKEIRKYCEEDMRRGILCYLFGNRDKLARWIMQKQDLQGIDHVSDQYWYMKVDGNVLLLPEDMFTDVEWIGFEGHQLCISANPEHYRVDENFTVRPPLAAAIRVICECDLPYEEYLAYIQDKKGPTIEQIMRNYRDYTSWMERIYTPMEEKVRHTFLGVRRSVDQIDVWHALKDKRQEIREAYQQEDVDKLSCLLDDYLERTHFYLKERIGFYIDEELFNAAKLVWESQGKVKYANRVYKLVPDLYKKESVDDYFARR